MPGSRPTPITPDTDGRVPVRGRARDARRVARLICVRERHEGDGVVNELVCIPTDGSGERDDRRGRSRLLLYAADLAGRDEARVADVGPAVPALGRLRAVGRGSRTRPAPSPVNAWSPGRPAAESIFQPAWSPDGVLHFVSDRTGLVEPLPRGATATCSAHLSDGCRVRLAAMGVRPLVVRVPRRRSHRVHLEPRRHAARRRARSRGRASCSIWTCRMTRSTRRGSQRRGRRSRSSGEAPRCRRRWCSWTSSSRRSTC